MPRFVRFNYGSVATTGVIANGDVSPGVVRRRATAFTPPGCWGQDPSSAPADTDIVGQEVVNAVSPSSASSLSSELGRTQD